MGVIDWPNIPFYIAPKIEAPGGPPTPGTVLAATGTQAQGYSIYPLTVSGDPSQLWIAVPDPLGGTVIQNLLVGQALSGVQGQGGAPSYVAIAPVSPTRPYQFWVVDDDPVTTGWMRIRCLPESMNWFMQSWVPMAPRDPLYILAGYNGDEAVFRVVPETGQITISDVSYQVAAAVTDLSVPPVSFLAIEVDNTSGTTAITQSIEVDGSIVQTTEFDTSNSDTTGSSLTASLPVKGVVSGVLKVLGAGSVENDTSNSVTWLYRQSQTQTWDHKVNTAVTVPAGKKYSYQQSVNYGKVQVPYNATGTLNSSIPGTPPLTFSLGSNFIGVNAMTSTITVRDVTPASPGLTGAAGGTAQVVHSVNVPLFTRTAVEVPAPQR